MRISYITVLVTALAALPSAPVGAVSEAQFETIRSLGVLNGVALHCQYLDETRPVFNWSEANACRFFVRIEDHTQAMNKSQYKVMKRYIEYHFYTYEAPQPAPPATVVSAAL